MSEPREWPNNYGQLRDDMAELLRAEIEKLNLITTNQVNDEEAMEAIAAQVSADLNLALRSLEKADARTDPLAELNCRVMKLKRNAAPVMIGA